MADDFDPYYTWLGIPPDEQPPDHYRLLGVRKFESNADVITNAMDQRMHYLRSLQVGKRSALSEKLLNEISAAGVCLLDPQRKAGYDQLLREKEAGTKASGGTPPARTNRPRPVAAPRAAQGPAPPYASSAPAAPMPVTAGEISAVHTLARKKSSLSASPVVWGGVAFASLATVGLAALVAVRSMQTPKEIATQNPNRPAAQHQGNSAGAGNGTKATNGKPSEAPRPAAVDPPRPASSPPDGAKPEQTTSPPRPAPAVKKWWEDESNAQRLFVLRFSGADHAELFNTSALMSYDRPFTVEAWVKVDLTRPGSVQVFGTRGGDSALGAIAGWSLLARQEMREGKPVYQWEVQHSKSGNRFTYHRATTPDLGQWTHLALVHEPQQAGRLFVNGRAVLTIQPEADRLASQRDLRLGSDSVAPPPPDAVVWICGLRLSSTARYQAAFTPPAPRELNVDGDSAVALDFAKPAHPDAVHDERGSHHARLAGAHWVSLNPSAPPPFPEPPASVPAGNRVDLLAAYGSRLLLIRGSVVRAGSALQILPDAEAAFEFPAALPEEYVLEAEVIRESGDESICFGFPIGGGNALTAIVDGAMSTKSGIASVNGQQVFTPDNPLVRPGALLTTGQPAVIRISVSKQAVELAVNGSVISRWARDPAATLAPAKGMGHPNLRHLAVMTWGAPYKITRLELLPAGSSENGPSSVVPALAEGGDRIDLVKTYRGQLSMRAGTLSAVGDGLRTEKPTTSFTIPADVPPEYVLEADVVREEGDAGIAFELPIGRKLLTALIDGFSSRHSGFGKVNGAGIPSKANPTVHSGPVFTSGKTAQIRIAVTRADVRLEVDGNQISRLPLDGSVQIEPLSGSPPGDPPRLGVTTWTSPFRILRMELVTARSGEASPLPPTSFAAKKQAVPPADAQAKALEQVTAVLGDELKGAKTPQAKATVAKKLADLARDTKETATRFVMLEEARRLYVEVKDVAAAMAAIEVLAADFDVSATSLRTKAIASMAEGSLPAAARADLVSEACALGYEAIDTEDFETAQELAGLVRSLAARAASPEVKLEAKEFTDEFASRQKRQEAIRKAEQTLAAAPDDPAANLTLGLHYCFDAADLAKGLPLLAKGSDAKLAAAAKARQANGAQGTAATFEEADAWFDSIATVSADYKAAVQKRALELYEVLAATAGGLDKAKAEKRRDQLKADLAASTPAATSPKRANRVRRTDLPESSPGMIGRVLLGGKDAGILVTYDPLRSMETQRLRDILLQAKAPGGRIVLVGMLTCPTPMSMYVSHRGASTAAAQQVLINGKVLSTVGGSRRVFDYERLQLPAGNHFVQWVIEFDGSTSPTLEIREEGNGRQVPLHFSRDQNYSARKLATSSEIDLTGP